MKKVLLFLANGFEIYEARAFIDAFLLLEGLTSVQNAAEVKRLMGFKMDASLMV